MKKLKSIDQFNKEQITDVEDIYGGGATLYIVFQDELGGYACNTQIDGVWLNQMNENPGAYGDGATENDVDGVSSVDN